MHISLHLLLQFTMHAPNFYIACYRLIEVMFSMHMVARAGQEAHLLVLDSLLQVVPDLPGCDGPDDLRQLSALLLRVAAHAAPQQGPQPLTLLHQPGLILLADQPPAEAALCHNV